MKTVARIIDLFGGMEKLAHIRLENPGFMRLVIERIGEGPRGWPAVSVAHYYEQNGDLMRDPDMVFEIDPDTGEWAPVSFQQDNLCYYREAAMLDETGRLIVYATTSRELREFASLWDRNLKDQGFLQAALQAQS